MDAFSKSLRQESLVLKRLFELCEENQGITNRVHIIDNGPHYEEETEYRVYHSDGYCFDIKREMVELDEGETNVEVIDGFVYEYFDGYDGFNQLPPALAIEVIEKELN